MNNQCMIDVSGTETKSLSKSYCCGPGDITCPQPTHGISCMMSRTYKITPTSKSDPAILLRPEPTPRISCGIPRLVRSHEHLSIRVSLLAD
jgi:hypothetical protein